MGKLKGGGKGSKKPKDSKAADKAKDLYTEAVDALAAAAGGDWLGPAHTPEQVKDALESTQGMNTDALREKKDDIARGGRPTNIKNKGLMKKIATALAGAVGGLIADQLLEKAYEWWRSDEQSQTYGEQVSEGADSIDAAEDLACEQAKDMCDQTKQQVERLAALLGTIDKTEFPDQYQGVLESADSLINQCGSSVVALAEDRDVCISEIFNQLIKAGSDICGEPVSEVPLACTQPCATPPPPPPPVCPPQSAPPAPQPTASIPAAAPPPAPPAQAVPETPVMTGTPEPVAPAPTAVPPASTSAAPPPVAPASLTPPCPPDKPMVPSLPTPEAPAEKPMPEPVTKPAAQDEPPVKETKPEPPTPQPCEEDEPMVAEKCNDPCADTATSSLTAIFGIGVAVAIIGAIISAAEEFLVPPEAPAPAPEPPPPPKENVPEPPPPPKESVPEPPPPPKESVPEQELVSSGVARKAGAW